MTATECIYIPHAQVAEYRAAGWTITDLSDTHHGRYSVIASRHTSATRTPGVSAPATADCPPIPAVAGNSLSTEADACRRDPASSLTTAAGCVGDCAPVGFLMER